MGVYLPIIWCIGKMFLLKGHGVFPVDLNLNVYGFTQFLHNFKDFA